MQITGFLSYFLFQSIRVTHESSAQEGQTEVCLSFRCFVWGGGNIIALKHNVCFCLSQAPSLDEKVNLHFIAFVNVGGHLYELGECPTAEEWKHLVICVTFLIMNTLIAHSAVIKLFVFVNPDGRKPFPIVHGKTSEDSFLEVRHQPMNTEISLQTELRFIFFLPCLIAGCCGGLQDLHGSWPSGGSFYHHCSLQRFILGKICHTWQQRKTWLPNILKC